MSKIKKVAFTGSRSGFSGNTLLPQQVAISVAQHGHRIFVGCALGVDAQIRNKLTECKFKNQLKVFKVASPSAGAPLPMAAALARRSQAMVSACDVLVGFASVACPSGVSPARHFCGGGSGTWASIAYAISQGKRVFVFAAAGVALPSWSGGAWVQAVPSGLWSHSFTWQPSGSQLSLL